MAAMDLEALLASIALSTTAVRYSKKEIEDHLENGGNLNLSPGVDYETAQRILDAAIEKESGIPKKYHEHYFSVERMQPIELGAITAVIFVENLKGKISFRYQQPSATEYPWLCLDYNDPIAVHSLNEFVETLKPMIKKLLP